MLNLQKILKKWSGLLVMFIRVKERRGEYLMPRLIFDKNIYNFVDLRKASLQFSGS
jgi:hypothetical protein